MSRRARFARASRVLLPLLLAALVVAGICLAIADHWRRGSAAFAAVAALAGLARLLLPRAWVGVLAVRSRAFDVTFLALLAALLAAMTLLVTVPVR